MAYEISFTLPRGYVDIHNRLHRDGRMRMATVMDEIIPNKHPMVQENESYALILLMSRVITQLGGLSEITPEIIESLFAADMAYLEALYLRLNAPAPVMMGVNCPHCQTHLQVQAAPLLQ